MLSVKRRISSLPHNPEFDFFQKKNILFKMIVGKGKKNVCNQHFLLVFYPFKELFFLNSCNIQFVACKCLQSGHK